MLLDTSGLLCLLHARESQHRLAVALFEATPVHLTHSYVLAEFIALAKARFMPRKETLDFVADLQTSSEVTVIFVDRSLHQTALELLQSRLDKHWSLCDAVSIVLMQHHGLAEALSTDHHFEQAGFVRLLKP